MLLLIATHLRERQLPQLEELASNILRIKVPVRSDRQRGVVSHRAFALYALHPSLSQGAKSGRFSHLRQVFLKVFTEEVCELFNK